MVSASVISLSASHADGTWIVERVYPALKALAESILHHPSAEVQLRRRIAKRRSIVGRAILLIVLRRFRT